LLFGILAYCIQADALGDLDAATVQLLKRAATVQSLNEVLPLVAARDQRKQAMVPGTVLTRCQSALERDPPLEWAPGAGRVSRVGLTGWPGFWRKAHAETPIPQR